MCKHGPVQIRADGKSKLGVHAVKYKPDFDLFQELKLQNC